MNTDQGFTLVELLVTLVVAGILITLAVPSYRDLMVSNRLSTTANDYVAALMEARMEAIRRNAQTQFCGSTGNGGDTLGAGCAAAGQVEVINSDGNSSVTRRASPVVRAGLNLTSVTALRFGGQGLARAIGATGPYTGLVVNLGSDQIDSRNRRCIYLATGSSISTCTATDTCPSTEPDDCL